MLHRPLTGNRATLVISAVRLFAVKIFVIIVLLRSSAASVRRCILYRDRRGQSTRTVKALTIRVALSVALFLLLMARILLGWVHTRACSRSDASMQKRRIDRRAAIADR